MSTEIIPVSIVIPTCKRAEVLRLTLESLAVQSCQPAQIILVDASDDSATRRRCAEGGIQGLCAEVIWMAAENLGAASQRNQGMRRCQYDIVGFFDDDILFEPECVRRLWIALNSDASLGGVNAMITNQRYHRPGHISRFMFWLMGGRRGASYAGCVLGPAINLLPEDRHDLPQVVQVEWLNTTCTFYRKEALPQPVFPDQFVGYSIMEDLSLSLTVGKRWRLANARTARIFHDSQPGPHKSDPTELAEMELVNRYYVMTRVLLRCRWRDYFRLALWESFQIAVVTISNHCLLRQIVIGKLKGIRRLFAFSGKC